MARQQSNSMRMVEPSVVEPAGGVRHEDGIDHGPPEGGGPVPPDNRPGHHPEHEQDRPDLDAFVERFRHAGEATGRVRPPEDRDGSPDDRVDAADDPTVEPSTTPGADRGGRGADGGPDDADHLEEPALPGPVATALRAVTVPVDRARRLAARPLRLLADLLDPSGQA